jgi:hypothetical protein
LWYFFLCWHNLRCLIEFLVMNGLFVEAEVPWLSICMHNADYEPAVFSHLLLFPYTMLHSKHVHRTLRITSQNTYIYYMASRCILSDSECLRYNLCFLEKTSGAIWVH